MSRIKNRGVPAWKSMPQLGRIACGMKNEKNIPINLDYFVVAFEPEYEYLKEPFLEMYGAKPQFFQNCFVLGNDAYSALNTAYEHYRGDACAIRCDGEEINMWLDDKFVVHHDRKPCQSEQGCKCKPVARFNLMLRDFCMKTGVLGAFKFVTHSNNNLDTLTATMDTFGNISAAYGVPVSQIPFTFSRKTQVIPVTDQSGKRIMKPMSLIAVEINFSGMMNNNALQGGEAFGELPAGDENGEVFMSLEDFLHQVSSANVVLSGEMFSEQTKKLGFESKEQIRDALASKKSPYTINKDDPTTYTIALGYLMLNKDIPNPWASALNAVSAAYADIPW